MLASASAAQAAVSFVNFGLPSIGLDLRRHFGLSLPELGGILTAGLLGSGLALIAAGIAVDRIGARRATFAGTIVGAAGLAGAAAAQSKVVLFVAFAFFRAATNASMTSLVISVIRRSPKCGIR